jgi:tetratricopeptide (TPR) repeat protein
VPAWRLDTVTAGAAGIQRRLDAPLVGRASELAQLLAAWRSTVDGRQAEMVTVAAPAGAGKTRLLAELAESVQPETQVLVGSCLAYGEGITYWPIAEAIRAAARIDADDSADVARAKLAALLRGEDDAADIEARIGGALGLPGAPAGREETFWAIRKLFEALARRRPLVVVLDDLHWAEETLLELVDHLAGWTRGVPLLLVCAARPELLERRPPAADAATLVLAPLDADAAGALMHWELDAAPLPPALRENILATSEGNPLFVQELVRMLIEDGAIIRADGGWQVAGDVAGLAMPATIQALLAARLDQLGVSERDVAQRASVVGHVFSRGAVHELCDAHARDGVTGHLQTLVRKELIAPEAGAQGAEDAFRFGHILVRDAAYAGLAKSTRAELHERFANWTEVARAGRLAEVEEILGYHLEQAASYSRELGHGGDAERVAVRASAHLASAGRRAVAAGDFPAAANLLDRAADTLPAGAPSRLEIRLAAIPALVEIGRFDAAGAHIDEILEHASQGRLLLAARAWRAFLHSQNDSTDTGEDCRAASLAWLAESERTGECAGQATALGFIAKMTFWDGQAAAAEELWMRAVAQAELAGDKREESESLVWLLIAGMFGPTPVETALERCTAIAARAGASLKVRVMASIERGVFEAMQGDAEGGRRRVAEGREQLAALGLAHLATVMAQEATIVEQLAGDPVRAEAILRPSIEAFERMGDTGFGFTHQMLLARALQEQGRNDEAAAVAEPYRAGSARSGEGGAGFYSGVFALVAAHEGRDEEALRISADTIAFGSESDFLRDLGDRFVDLADIHALAGRRAEALAALARADELYERKGCVASLQWTARRRAGLA